MLAQWAKTCSPKKSTELAAVVWLVGRSNASEQVVVSCNQLPYKLREGRLAGGRMLARDWSQTRL